MIRVENDIIVIDKPLYITIQRDNLECFQEMTTVNEFLIEDVLSQKVSPKSYQFKDIILRDYPPLLCVCVFFKAVKIVNYLLMNDVDLRAFDKKGRTVAHFAAAGGNLQILLLLNDLNLDFVEEDFRVFFEK